MKMPYLATTLVIGGLIFGICAGGQPNSSQDSVTIQKNKKKKGTHRTRVAKKARVPAGVPTSLPQKGAPSTPPSSEGQSRFGTETLLPATQRAGSFHGSANVFSDSITKDDAHLGFNRVWALTFQPRVAFDFTNDFSAYATDNFTNYAPSGLGEISIINRPEVGLLKDIIHDDDFTLAAGLSVKLPIFDAGGSDLFADPMRVWQFGPGVTADYQIPETATHIIAQLRATYDTKATFSHLTSDPETGATVESDSYIRPITLGSSLGLSRDGGSTMVGLVFHGINQLAPPRLTAGGNTLREISPLSLLRGEVFLSYKFQERTYVHGSVSKGLRTSNDIASYALYDYTQDIADTSLSLGVTQTF